MVFSANFVNETTKIFGRDAEFLKKCTNRRPSLHVISCETDGKEGAVGQILTRELTVNLRAISPEK